MRILLCIGALLLLTACSGGSETPKPETSTRTAESTASDDDDPVETPDDEMQADECITGEWRADLDGLVAQLAQQLSSTGLPVNGSEAGGSQSLVIRDDGTLFFDNDMTLWVTVQMGAVEMTVRQEHTGLMSADWSWAEVDAEGGTLEFDDFDDSGYTVQSTFEGDGASLAAPSIELPRASASNVPTAVTCRGDTLTTQPQGTPFITSWNRIG